MFNNDGEPLVLPLAHTQATLDYVGGKGASLSRLVRASMPVPPAFHVTTAAYGRFVASNHLRDAILQIAREPHGNDPAALDTTSARLAALFMEGTIPDEVVEAICDAYTELGAPDPAVAVRSSATAEDLPGMSFAGQQATYLNIRGEAALLLAIKRCWASLWTARALDYRARHGIPPETVSLAVVVQELVPAEVAGVLFTANPVNGARNEALINAAWGLGEAVVSGLVNPDLYVVDKRNGALLTQQIADKALMTVRTVDGTQDVPVPTGQRRASTLSPGQVTALTELGLRIEALYGQPMDIEWVLHHDRISIVQARPITALPIASRQLNG